MVETCEQSMRMAASLPVVQASGLIFSITYIGLNLLADVLSMLSNPKLRQSQF